MPWHGPYRIRQLLEKAIDNDRDWPSSNTGIYVITRKLWQAEPTRRSNVLYVGGNTGRSKRFCTRIGDLVADMFGFYAGGTGHHSGGQSIWKWCRKNNVKPGNLYIGWKDQVRCKRCAEVHVYEDLQPKLNKTRPPRCKNHG